MAYTNVIPEWLNKQRQDRVCYGQYYQVIYDRQALNCERANTAFVLFSFFK